jgi:Rrf2 family protein
MFDLARNYGKGPIPLKAIAERQQLSDNYLEQLIAALRKAGLVKSIRGAQGGYILAHSPAEITVGDIVRVLEGPIAPLECVNEDEPGDCEQLHYCISRNVWAKVRDSITDVIDSISLADMCQEADEIEQIQQN